MSIAIKTNGLSKCYRIGIKEKMADTFGGAVLGWAKSPLSNFRNLRRLTKFQDDDTDLVWSVRDVDLTIKEGEVLGIIGHNGAGKSTLLKLLSKITRPTQGSAEIKGRVASLLEVGTGFHPDLSGRENIYLNATILGMRKKEVDRKFDEIVSFAGIERFIDTPVKRYSSGMRLRLGFSVAAHLEPEILLVDEVLAVGDQEFQEKCLGKMGQVAEGGRTILFVSHNMGALQTLCSRAVVLNQGRIVGDGDPHAMVKQYLGGYKANYGHSDPSEKVDDDTMTIEKIQVVQGAVGTKAIFSPHEPISIIVDYQVKEPIQELLLGFEAYSSDGIRLFRTYDLNQWGMGRREPGRYRSIVTFPEAFFQDDFYYFDLYVGLHRHRWISKGKVRLKVSFEGASLLDVTTPGVLQPLGSWQVERTSS